MGQQGLGHPVQPQTRPSHGRVDGFGQSGVSGDRVHRRWEEIPSGVRDFTVWQFLDADARMPFRGGCPRHWRERSDIVFVCGVGRRRAMRTKGPFPWIRQQIEERC